MCGITVTVLSSLTDNATNGGIDLLARRQQLNYYAAAGTKARMDICCFPQILVCFKLLSRGDVFKIHEGGYNQPFYINYMYVCIGAVYLSRHPLTEQNGKTNTAKGSGDGSSHTYFHKTNTVQAGGHSSPHNYRDTPRGHHSERHTESMAGN